MSQCVSEALSDDNDTEDTELYFSIGKHGCFCRC